MALALIQNALQINFDSVLSLYDGGMVSMFKALESSGLRGFLGCSAPIYEKDLVTLFENAIVRGNTVISTVQGMFVEITEEQFAGIFDLPFEGQTSVNDLPANLINEQSRGFVVQLSLLLEGVPGLKLGESKAFPPLKILTVKSVGTYIAKNKSVSMASDEVKEESVVETVVTVEGADPKHARLALPIISKQKNQLPNRPFVDAFAPICIFIEPVHNISSRRPYSAIFQRNWGEVCTGVIRFSIFGHLQTVGSTVNTCTDIVVVNTVFSTDTVPHRVFDAVQHGQSDERFVDFFVKLISDSSTSSSSTSSSSTSSTDSPIHFSEDLPRFDMPTVVFHPPDFIESTAQLRASIDHLQFEQLQTRESVEALKYDLPTKITKLELGFCTIYLTTGNGL
ncbi:protein tipD [Dorcoceras hygrometricum]|uniref:Protein tipD n=1 Tax=Dorcoceras hygrometricum TaxID=472368 RepID=A0A2Z7BYD8_9LAMI|nr:protein tipD [Dorcoceras hygrometricum]